MRQTPLSDETQTVMNTAANASFIERKHGVWPTTPRIFRHPHLTTSCFTT